MNLLVFDIDGTLLDSTGVDEECYERAMKETHHIVFDDFDWEKFSDVTDQGVTEDILKNHFGRIPTEEEIGVVERKMGELVWAEKSSHSHKFHAASGVESLINELLNQGDTAFCMATGAWRESALAKLSSLDNNLTPIPWEHAGKYRKRSEIVKSAIEKSKKHYGVEHFSSICALGDGKWDFMTAAELKINFIGVDLHQNGRLKQLGAKKVIHEYGNLDHLIPLAFH